MLLRRYLGDLKLSTLPTTLDEYLKQVVTPTLERRHSEVKGSLRRSSLIANNAGIVWLKNQPTVLVVFTATIMAEPQHCMTILRA